ncbi:MAG: hypothetical protein K2V38_21815, partial [Gemmataceae bacterium]|nr:hypothetical protein [Gemmataceae bacterium]
APELPPAEPPAVLALSEATRYQGIELLREREDLLRKRQDLVREAVLTKERYEELVKKAEGYARKAEENLKKSDDKFARAYELLKAGMGVHAAAVKAGKAKPETAAPLHAALAARESERGKVAAALAVIEEGLKALPGSPGLLGERLGYQIRSGDAAGAEGTLAELGKIGQLRPGDEPFFNGRIRMLRGQWAEAARDLEFALRESVGNATPGRAHETNLYLGRCYEQLGRTEQRLAAFTAAKPADPGSEVWLPALFGKAEAELAAGRVEDAEATYREAADRLGGLTWMPVARIRVRLAIQSTPDQKAARWAAAEEALGRAEQTPTKDDQGPTAEAIVLRANVLVLRDDKWDEARKLLEGLRAAELKKKKEDRDPSAWVTLAGLDQRTDPRRSLAVLAEGEREVGDSVA